MKLLLLRLYFSYFLYHKIYFVILIPYPYIIKFPVDFSKDSLKEKLLEKGCYKVYEVAERSGFSDVKYFMKQFREETGLSPTEWANKHKNMM